MRSLALLPLLVGLPLLTACEEGRQYAETVVGGLEKGQATGMKVNLQTLAHALEAYQLDHGRYPDRLSDLPDIASGRSSSADAWGQPLVYRSTSTGYEVRCIGADGEPETEDDIVLVDGRVE